ncbi:hypothetical protein [Bacillus massilinigeriensis]|uniref:hypothetical protein n=1 Tax=Bacillus massilionigeriensis TaxID=1805475 RepID=UPI00096B56DA|nr:hypothetical protein [Bacillus massilionigeriensis]
MKRLILLFVTALVIYIIYYDLTNGTLPAVTEQKTEAKEKSIDLEEGKIAFFTYEVKRGETVLSIVEKQLESSPPVSINQVIEDFIDLNGIKPENIQTGKTYKFPNYHEKLKSNP